MTGLQQRQRFFQTAAREGRTAIPVASSEDPPEVVIEQMTDFLTVSNAACLYRIGKLFPKYVHYVEGAIPFTDFDPEEIAAMMQVLNKMMRETAPLGWTYALAPETMTWHYVATPAHKEQPR